MKAGETVKVILHHKTYGVWTAFLPVVSVTDRYVTVVMDGVRLRFHASTGSATAARFRGSYIEPADL